MFWRSGSPSTVHTTRRRDGHNPRQLATNQLEHQMVLKNSTRTLIEIKSATVPSGSSGRVWSTCLVFWSSDVPFLSFKGTHSPTVGFLRKTRVPFFTPFLCRFFRPPFLQRLSPKTLKMRAPKQLKIMKKCKKSHRNAPTVRTCKKTESGRVQASGIDNLYNTFSCFPKGPDLSK